ncbi:hypothetical protein C7B62_22405 [Pleurocapsa sp. CCALA 161]|uniref:hypothetical protein n=1 Tax=Pleurocapsa sp. CCALA 161 TaxID=2107688 RepID=UPI000D04BCC8|nr:hypothetical protein [Pleurocapsa sp. CCALA 161]PSB06594.1 hypothetical protein C7B62_22405 [Pleurocapsa sp. CCALA 161]
MPISAQYPPKLDVRNVGSKISTLNNLIESETNTPDTPNTPKQRINNVDNTRNRTPEELQEIEDRYSYNLNEKGETIVSYIPLASNELERLNNLKESTINEIRNDLCFYKETALYSEIVNLLNTLDERVKQLS